MSIHSTIAELTQKSIDIDKRIRKLRAEMTEENKEQIEKEISPLDDRLTAVMRKKEELEGVKDFV